MMAREIRKICDICKKPTKQIVGKLHFIPAIPGVSAVVHSNYTHHADVGECCKNRLLTNFSFRERVSAEEYRKQRRAG